MSTGAERLIKESELARRRKAFLAKGIVPGARVRHVGAPGSLLNGETGVVVGVDMEHGNATWLPDDPGLRSGGGGPWTGNWSRLEAVVMEYEVGWR